LVVENGFLIGARGIHVFSNQFDRGFFDVEFVDGKCSEVYGACDSAHAAGGGSGVIAQQALESAYATLRSSVFIDGPDGLFNSFPSLIQGCQGTDVTCLVYTPEFVVGGIHASAIGIIAGRSPCTSFGCYDSLHNFPGDDVDFSEDPTRTWARWKRSPVAEPLSISSLAMAGGFLLAVARKRKSVQCGSFRQESDNRHFRS